MRWTTRMIPLAFLILGATACASRAPVTDVPTGIYVLVEPEVEEYNAVAVAPRAFTVRDGNQIYSGEHWVDGAGRLRMATYSGPCAGEASIWDYNYQSPRVTLTLVEDQCQARSPALPERMVYERR